MTDDRAFKRSARELAAREGISYADARTRLLNAATSLVDRVEAIAADASEHVDVIDHTLDVPRPEGAFRLFQIQQSTRENFQTPYPFFVDEWGCVLYQDMWNGDPWHLIGFEDRSPEFLAAREREGIPGGRNIALRRDDFFENPERAHGLHPVFAEVDGTWSSRSPGVAAVTVHWATHSLPADDIHATFRVTRLVDGVVVETVGFPEVAIGDLLTRLPRTQLDALSQGQPLEDAADTVLLLGTPGGELSDEPEPTPVRTAVDSLLSLAHSVRDDSFRAGVAVSASQTFDDQCDLLDGQVILEMTLEGVSKATAAHGWHRDVSSLRTQTTA